MHIAMISPASAVPALRQTAALYERHANLDLSVNPADWAGDVDTIHDLKKALFNTIDSGDFAKAMHILQVLQKPALSGAVPLRGAGRRSVWAPPTRL